MFICYCDESGFTGAKYDPDQPVCVVAGVLANVYHMQKSLREFEAIISEIRDTEGLPPLPNPQELKGDQLYAGRGEWANVDGDVRHVVYEGCMDWLSNRKHKILYGAINAETFFDQVAAGDACAMCFRDPYTTAAYQVVMTVERKNKNMKSNKGNTLFIFDEQHSNDRRLQDLVTAPPDWTCDYCGTDSQEPITQMIDTVLFTRSHMSPFVQLADLTAYVIRRYLMLEDFGEDERFDGELEQARRWVKTLAPRLVGNRHMYPSNRCDVNELYRAVTPDHALELASAKDLRG